MQNKIAICFAGAVASLVAFSVPAAAQAQLPSYEVATIVRSMGLDPVGGPSRRGPAYVQRALDGYGQPVSVTLDARSGRVMSVQPLAIAAVPYPAPPAYVPEPGYVGPPYAVPAYPPEPYYPEAQVYSYPAYGPPPPAGPRVIYAPRESYNVPRPPAPVPSVKKPTAKPAPKTASSSPPKTMVESPPEATSEVTTGTVNAVSEKPAEEKSSAVTLPPVQGME